MIPRPPTSRPEWRLPGRSVNWEPWLAPVGVALLLLMLPFVFGLGREGGMELANFEPLFRLSTLQFLAFGLVWTVSVALVAILVSLPLATLFALGRLSGRGFIRWPSIAYIEGIRSLPVLLLIFYMFFRLGSGQLPFVSKDALAVIIALTLYTAAVNAEVIRAGIVSLPKGQFEAAQALGMTYPRMMQSVILPQSFRRVLPTLIAQFTTVVKDTSLGAIIGTVELAQRGRIVFQGFRNPLETYFVIAIMYFVVNFILGRISLRIQRRRKTTPLPREVQEKLFADEMG